MKTLFTIMLVAMFATMGAQDYFAHQNNLENGNVQPYNAQAYASESDVTDFDINQPVRNTAEFRAVVMSDPCIATLALKELFQYSIKEEDVRNTSLPYKVKLGNAQEFDNDYIKLKCTRDSFLRWQILKSNNYNFLNNKQ